MRAAGDHDGAVAEVEVADVFAGVAVGDGGVVFVPAGAEGDGVGTGGGFGGG